MDLPAGEPAIRTIAMPADTNPAGDIFGGWLMAQMDLAAGNAAARRARGPLRHRRRRRHGLPSPVFVGDEVSLYAEIVAGRPHLDQHHDRGMAPRPRRRRVLSK